MFTTYDIFTPFRWKDSRIIYFIKSTFKNGKVSFNITLIISMHIPSGPGKRFEWIDFTLAVILSLVFLVIKSGAIIILGIFLKNLLVFI